jgi:hypothetical protein
MQLFVSLVEFLFDLSAGELYDLINFPLRSMSLIGSGVMGKPLVGETTFQKSHEVTFRSDPSTP